MTKNLVFILTEGDHDAAFIYRILKANGMATNHQIPIKDYHYPLNELIKNGVSSTSIEELNMETARSKFLPSYIMEEDNNLVTIYRTGGDSKASIREGFIKQINAFNVQDPDAVQLVKDTNISVLFFFDADDKGVENRMAQIRGELKKSFPSSCYGEIDTLKEKDVLLIEDIKVGGFIFTKVGETVGLLEDILVPLMREDNDDIFDSAEDFLAIHEQTNLFKGKVTYCSNDSTIKKKVNGKKYSHEKSLIGTVGQLQKSGASNTMCISQTDYLNETKIKANQTCVDIFSFIMKALT